MSLLEVEALKVRLANGHEVLRGLDFELRAGETLALIGESGSGKSMTALALMGLLPEGSRALGRIEFDGQPLLGLQEGSWRKLRGRRIALVPQEPLSALNPLQRALDQVMLPLRAHRLHEGAEARARELLARVGLAESRWRAWPHELSGGQRQRVLIAQALAARPALLIADEPTSALDGASQRQVLELLAELGREQGLALLLISHDLGLVARRAQRLLVMYGGRLMEQGPAVELLTQPAHPYTAALLAARPGLLSRGQVLPAIPGSVPAAGHWPAGCPFAGRCPQGDERCAAEAPPVVATDERSTSCWRRIG
ncbi:ABC transporter ATP-binding protein [Pelomonas sp. SE-A7]|uniref:ABC transporter ATP-binding protein n=1 Tax=Pelomonas sp. SE-A7 TaxID=3054953 RepID=UPI00259CCB5A|nr:ABC transporter ATP-binding protein [Pelomonas sp. SE-A7]MDM4768182.1 ABC transporter ATP-binding protein [Pelomonas sp. SE-A7]